jgi:peptide deformylase
MPNERKLTPEELQELLEQYRRNLQRRNPRLDARIEDGKIVAVDAEGRPLLRWASSAPAAEPCWGEPLEDRLLVVGAVLLRTRARDVRLEEIKTAAFRRLCGALYRQMARDVTVGLAAPQVGCGVRVIALSVGRQLFEALSEARARDAGAYEVPFTVLVNPRIVWRGGTDSESFELCQSIPGYLGVVPRAWEVRVEALDTDGQPTTVEATGFHARILQHEIDHLDGRLYIDAMDPRTFVSREAAIDVIRAEPFAAARAKLLPYLDPS